jgi:hypothetical protein
MPDNGAVVKKKLGRNIPAVRHIRTLAGEIRRGYLYVSA